MHNKAVVDVTRGGGGVGVGGEGGSGSCST